MPLTTVVGSSGSGKTTFLNDVHKSHKCTYIRQYHNLRPYIAVSKIPNFDPTSLPYWDIYQREGTDSSITVGGTMAGQFYPGLSGGQRKLLLFELIYQRTINQKQLLIVLDEPFAGVTDNFVPFIVNRLELMSKTHNILLVTNDHVQTLTDMADNIITVSAIDRTTVKINNYLKVDRTKAIAALSIGDDFVYSSNNDDFKFFLDVEVIKNAGIIGVAGFTVFAFLLFLLSFWDSSPQSASMILVATGIISYFAINPYLLSLTDWRNYMNEEAEALLHSSKSMNKVLKSLLLLSMNSTIGVIQWGFINATVDGLESVKFLFAILFDNFSLIFPFIAFGIYSNLPHQAVETLSLLPFLFMIFFSTTFSPGSGVPVVKELRYLFPRYYTWCLTPFVKDQMEGCPADDGQTMLYLILASFIGVFLFSIFKGVSAIRSNAAKAKSSQVREALEKDTEFQRLQLEMFGAEEVSRLTHAESPSLTFALAQAQAGATIASGEEDGEAKLLSQVKEESTSEGTDASTEPELRMSMTEISV